MMVRKAAADDAVFAGKKEVTGDNAIPIGDAWLETETGVPE
jgi:hypothetical protein